MKIMKKIIKQEEEKLEDVRPGRYEAPTTMSEKTKTKDILDKKRYDICDEKVEWKVD